MSGCNLVNFLITASHDGRPYCNARDQYGWEFLQEDFFSFEHIFSVYFPDNFQTCIVMRMQERCAVGNTVSFIIVSCVFRPWSRENESV